MFAKTSALLALVATLSPAVNALGNAIIKNQCSAPAYMWVVGDGLAGEMVTIPAGAKNVSPYQALANGGVSMKIASEPTVTGAITQYEYTIGGGFVWYDISNINGYPSMFESSGIDVIPSVSTCPSKVCPAGVELCTNAYNQPDDNDATAACSPEADTTVILCAHQVGGDIAPAATSVAKLNVEAVTAAPAATPDVYTTFITQVVTRVVTIDSVAKRAAIAEPTGLAMHEEVHEAHKRFAHSHHFQRHAADSN